MWEVNGTPVAVEQFASFEPVRVLNYYDGARVFTFKNSDGGLCLACWSDEDENRSRFLVVPITEQAVADLVNGFLTVSHSMAQEFLWVVDMSGDRTLSRAWLVACKNVPEDAKPQQGTMLHRSLGPMLSLGDPIPAGDAILGLALTGEKQRDPSMAPLTGHDGPAG